jgi:hypothetical protein
VGSAILSLLAVAHVVPSDAPAATVHTADVTPGCPQHYCKCVVQIAMVAPVLSFIMHDTVSATVRNAANVLATAYDGSRCFCQRTCHPNVP